MLSHSVESDSLQLHDCRLSGSSVHGNSQVRMLEWAAISFFRGSSQPQNQTCISCLARGFFTTEATWETCTVIQNDNIKGSQAKGLRMLHYLVLFI